MAGKKQRNREVEARFRREVKRESERSIRVLLLVETARYLGLLTRWGVGGYVVIATARAFAGQETAVTVSAALEAAANIWVYLVIAGLFGGGWFVQTKALRKRIKTLSDHNRKLEQILDPDRSSSGMNADGSSPLDKGEIKK